MSKQRMEISPIPTEHHGDWHDKPTRWAVYGPGDEVQKFPTKAEATLYRKIRRASASFNEALGKYVQTA